LAVDVDHGFEPRYEVIEGKKKLIGELKQTAGKVQEVYLAADPDREGEAICYHLQEELGGRKNGPRFYRVMFNEITKKAVQKAFEKPGQVNIDLVDAQQARRVLDRLVGYKISPLLWDKVRRGLSAGRVQTVALRLVVEREREIRAFLKKEYWTIDVDLAAKKPPLLTARLIRQNDETPEIGAKETADGIVAQLEGADYTVRSVGTREKKRNPVAPFITSTLQQESSRKLRFSVKRTMMLAQRLYEGVEIGKEGAVGLITYMRTDSTRVSDDAVSDARHYIAERYGREFVPDSPNIYKSKKAAQDAHEAIRPTSMAFAPEIVEKYLAEDEMKLYRLVWNRFVACQMMPALFDQTTIDVAAKGTNGADYLFRATGSVLKFEGFLKAYQEGKDQADEEDEELRHRLPAVAEGEHLRFRAIKPEQHFTEPPPRYNEATLVKRLEADGVGRPSTYASILSTIQEREYVSKEGGRFVPSELGMVVTDLLLESFDDIFDVTYTARMEEELDEIEEGKLDWRACHGGVLRALRPRSEARRRAHDRHQADGEAHRLDLREVRQAPGDQVGQARQLHRLHGLPRVHLHARADGGPAGCRQGRPNRAGRRGVLRKLRPPDGAEEGPVRHVLRLHRIPRLQDHQAHRRTAEKARPAARREVPAVRQPTGAEDRPLRRVHRVQQLPHLQVRQAENHRGEVPGVLGGRDHRAPFAQGQDFLRLQPVSGLQVRGVGQAGGGEVPRVRQPLHGGKVAQGRPHVAVSQPRVQAQAARPPAARRSAGPVRRIMRLNRTLPLPLFALAAWRYKWARALPV
jgi:DNA topoisomerase I